MHRLLDGKKKSDDGLEATLTDIIRCEHIRYTGCSIHGARNFGDEIDVPG